MNTSTVDLNDPLQFDIKAKSPHRHQEYSDPTFDPVAKATYYEINFMVRLMWGLRYSVVHGPFSALITGILNNIGDTDVWPTEYDGAKPILEGHLATMASMQVIQDGLTHRSLYESYNPHAADFVRESALLRQNLENSNELFLICLPFIDFQTPDQRIWPDPARLPSAINQIARFTLHQLYLSRDARTEFSSIRFLRGSSVLQSRYRERSGGGGGNNHKCDGNNDCEPEPDHYCSEDEDGNCSAMSDP